MSPLAEFLAITIGVVTLVMLAVFLVWLNLWHPRCISCRSRRLVQHRDGVRCLDCGTYVRRLSVYR